MFMSSAKLLISLAVGVCHYQVESQKPDTSPLPMLSQPLQTAWNQLTMECIKKKIHPPKDLQEFIAWLTTPIEEWKCFGEEWSRLGWSGCLIEDFIPTELSYSLSQRAHETPNLEDHTYSFNELRDYCKEKKDASLYSKLRLYVCENPILKDIMCLMDIDGVDSKCMNWLKNFYEPIPSHCIRNNQVIVCKYCGWPLKWKNGQLFCLDDLCKKATHDFLNIEENQYKQVGKLAHQTTFSVQRSIVRPEANLLPLFEQVKKHRHIAYYEFWPQYDSFDLYIVFQNGEKWAVDMKDYQSPKNLARELNRSFVPYIPEWDRFFYLFPNHRKKINHFYLDQFLEEWDGKTKPEFAVMFVDEFVPLLDRSGSL